MEKKLKIKAYFLLLLLCCACCCYVFLYFLTSPFFPHLWTCESWTLISLESISVWCKVDISRLMAKGMFRTLVFLRNHSPFCLVCTWLWFLYKLMPPNIDMLRRRNIHILFCCCCFFNVERKSIELSEKSFEPFWLYIYIFMFYASMFFIYFKAI